MEKSIEELFEEKTRVVLNLIRPNNTATDAQQITQSLRNIVDANTAFVLLQQNSKPKKPSGG